MVVPKRNSCWTVAFHCQDSGVLKIGSCDVSTSGKLSAPPAAPPLAVSTTPFVTATVGWNGGLPPRNTESLTPNRVKYRPIPVRNTVLSENAYARPRRGCHWL